jgi:hypothetical protein
MSHSEALSRLDSGRRGRRHDQMVAIDKFERDMERFLTRRRPSSVQSAKPQMPSIAALTGSGRCTAFRATQTAGLPRPSKMSRSSTAARRRTACTGCVHLRAAAGVLPREGPNGLIRQRAQGAARRGGAPPPDDMQRSRASLGEMLLAAAYASRFIASSGTGLLYAPGGFLTFPCGPATCFASIRALWRHLWDR